MRCMMGRFGGIPTNIQQLSRILIGYICDGEWENVFEWLKQKNEGTEVIGLHIK